MKGPIQAVEVTYLVHETEDPRRIEKAISKLMGQVASPETERLEGHFGNQIERSSLHLTGPGAESAFRQIVAAMPKEMVDDITSNIGSHLDEHSALFIRLDKQRLVSGTLALGSGDPVRVKIKPRAFMMKDGAARFYLNALGRG